MAVKLQMEDGEFKEYPTVYVGGLIGGETHLPDKYVTKCGQVWRSDPGPGEDAVIWIAQYVLQKSRRDLDTWALSSLLYSLSAF